MLDEIVNTYYRHFKLKKICCLISSQKAPVESCMFLVFQLPPGSSRHYGKGRKSRSERNSRYSRSTGPGWCKRREGWVCDGEVWRAVETQLQAMCLELSQLRHWPGQNYSKVTMMNTALQNTMSKTNKKQNKTIFLIFLFIYIIIGISFYFNILNFYFNTFL